MYIVNLEQFRALPPYTVFRKYEPCIAGDLSFKFDTWEHDFISMTVEFPESNSSDELFARLDEMERTGCSYQLDVDCAGRDGLFEKDQLFLIYDAADLTALRGLIDIAIASAAPTPTSKEE